MTRMQHGLLKPSPIRKFERSGGSPGPAPCMDAAAATCEDHVSWQVVMAAPHHKGAAAVHQAVLVPTDVDGDHMLQTEVEHNIGLDQGRNQACKGKGAESGTPRRRRSSEAADTSSLARETCKAMYAYKSWEHGALWCCRPLPQLAIRSRAAVLAYTPTQDGLPALAASTWMGMSQPFSCTGDEKERAAQAACM